MSTAQGGRCGWRVLFALALACAATSVPARSIEGRVLRVVDGDTLDVAPPGERRLRVRLGAIDAPELDQPHGRAAGAHLRRLALRRPVTVETVKRDANGRWVGQVWVAPAADCPDAAASCPRSLDLGLAQLSAGLAWHYRHYAREQDAASRSRYAQAERMARSSRRGLWSSRRPVAPWDWRHRRAR